MKQVVCWFLVLLATPAFSQEETLLNGQIENGGFGGPVVKFSGVKNQFAVFVGGYGGWLINHTFMLGGGGYGLVTQTEPPAATSTFYGLTPLSRMEFGYGGGVIEVMMHPTSLVHSSVSVLIGAGGVTLRERNAFEWSDWDTGNHNADAVFVAEPAVNAEVNVTTFFRINVGASYRFVSGVNTIGLSNSDLSGPSVNLAFKFGAF